MTEEYYIKHVKPTMMDDVQQGKRILELSGRRFGRLVVVGRVPEDGVRGNSPMWYCKCDCGNPELFIVDTDALREGSRMSCGCLEVKEVNRKARSEAVERLMNENQVIRNTKIVRPFRCEFKTWKQQYPWEKRRLYDPGIKKSVPIDVFETWYDMVPGQVARYYKKGYTTSEITYVATHHDAYAKKDENGMLRDKDGFLCLIKRIKETPY